MRRLFALAATLTATAMPAHTETSARDAARDSQAAPTLRSTAAQRDAISITVYNQDFGLVRELRTLDLRSGQVSLEYGDVASKIQPETVHIRPIGGPEFAAELEAEAYRLHSMPARWSDAASLYVAAAQLRQREDPQARQNLFVAANLYYQAGDKQAAVMALESAGARAVSSGDAVLAAQMFANAAIVAEEAGMVSEGRRLRSRVADLAYAGGSGTRTRS
jgi:hypothetical protein